MFSICLYYIIYIYNIYIYIYIYISFFFSPSQWLRWERHYYSVGVPKTPHGGSRRKRGGSYIGSRRSALEPNVGTASGQQKLQHRLRKRGGSMAEAKLALEANCDQRLTSALLQHSPPTFGSREDVKKQGWRKQAEARRKLYRKQTNKDNPLVIE